MYVPVCKYVSTYIMYVCVYEFMYTCIYVYMYVNI